jgi:hypothetical protein
MGPRIDAEVHDASLHWDLRIADVEHPDLTRLEQSEQQPIAC